MAHGVRHTAYGILIEASKSNEDLPVPLLAKEGPEKASLPCEGEVGRGQGAQR